MLDLAINHVGELRGKLNNLWFDEEYKYFNYHSYYSKYDPSHDGTWAAHEFVSLNKDGEVIGYICYDINRETYSCGGLGIVNFSDNKITFAKDLNQALHDIFYKFKFNKLSFSVVIGNPIEKSYDRLIKKYNGRIVGVKEKETKLMDGELYDVKEYEIMRDNYLKTQKTKKS